MFSLGDFMSQQQDEVEEALVSLSEILNFLENLEAQREEPPSPSSNPTEAVAPTTPAVRFCVYDLCAGLSVGPAPPGTACDVTQFVS